jgi:hypothetical protein
MKKLLLIVIALSAGFLANSQRPCQLTKQQKDYHIILTAKSDVKEEISFNNVFDPTVRSASTAPQETIVGNTKYDLQSNTMVSGRIYQHADGTVGAVWTQGFDDANTFPERGTGYNYFDGSEWDPIPTARIESVRCGWPNYSSWGENGEIVISHNGVTGLQISKRAEKGTGTWEEALYQGPPPIENDPTWPRIATGGENHETIHMIYNSYVAYNDQTTALLYSRSNDGGETWDPQDLTFDEFGPGYYSGIAADSYTIAARGNTVAILLAHTWTSDLALLKSEDNGETWEHTIIWEHPYPFYDWDVTITDTFFAVDGSASMAIGPDGKVHVAFGICRVLHDVVGTNYTYWPGAEGIGYWNEDMPVFSNNVNALSPPEWGFEDTELIDDYNRIGWWQDVNGNEQDDRLEEQVIFRTIGYSTGPAITIDDNYNIFVAYASLTETYDNTTNNFRHIWTRAFANNIWGSFTDVTSDIIHIFDECVYPVLSPTSNDNVHLLFMADNFPGLAWDGDHAYVTNNLYYSAIPKEDLLTGISHHNTLIDARSVSQNYPNPFTGMTTITVNLSDNANLSLTVSNMLGQEIMNIRRGTVPPGSYLFELDGTNLTSGIYFYTVKADDSSVTKKMIVH